MTKEEFLLKWGYQGVENTNCTEELSKDIDELIKHLYESQYIEHNCNCEKFCSCTQSQCSLMNGKYICSTCNKPLQYL